MIQYMLDTNTVSHIINKHSNVVKNLVSVPITSVCISAITEGELLFGLAKRPEAKRLHFVVREFLKCVDVMPWDSETAERYGVVRAEMACKGKTLSPLDLLIATHALSIGAVLITNGQAFLQTDGLRIEDWTKG